MYTSALCTISLFLATLVLYVYWYFKKCHKFFFQYNIPYHKPHWFFGNMKDVVLGKKALWLKYKNIYENFPRNRFAGVYTLHSPTVMIRDPELIKLVLVKDFSYFHDRTVPVSKHVEPIANNLFHMQGDEWKNLRIKLTSTFTSRKMKMMFPLVKKCAEDIKLALTEHIQHGDDFEAKDICARFTTDVIGSCAFGIDIHSLQDPESEFRKVGKRVFEPRWQFLVRMVFPNLPDWFVKFFKLYVFPKKETDYFTKIVKEIVKYREENNSTRDDFLDLLIAIKNNKKIQKFDDQIAEKADLAKFMAQVGEKTDNTDTEMTIELMAAQCFVFFLAGFEGASTTLMFILYELARNIDMQNKLRKEILSTIESNRGEITYEMMKAMPYLDMIMAEIMRKYPPGEFLVRECTKNYSIPDSDAIIKKGTQVIISISGLHSDKKYFEKPNEFYPEHFTTEAKLKRHHFAYMPFGEGPRICIAERFARMQIIVGVIYLLKDFSFQLAPRTKVPLEWESSGGNGVKDGVWLKCQPL